MSQCNQSAVLKASIEKVWNAIKDFHDMSWAPNVVSSCEKVGTIQGDKVGAKRILNEAFHATLLSIDEKAYMFTYSLDEGVSPVSSQEVSNYIGEVKLHTTLDENQTLMTWNSTWESNTNHAVEFCDMLHNALMDDLANSLVEVKA